MRPHPLPPAGLVRRRNGHGIARRRDHFPPLGSFPTCPRLFSATAEYQVGERTWTHAFTAMRLDEEELRPALSAAGLRFDRCLTSDHSWLRAVPASAS